LARRLRLARGARSPRRGQSGLRGRAAHQLVADVRTVETDAGPTLIAPHSLAYGLIGAVVEHGAAQPSFRREYAEAAAEALAVLIGGMEPADQVAFGLAAMTGVQ
jgi:hypothetical protein